MNHDAILIILGTVILLAIIVPSIDASKIILEGGAGFCQILAFGNDTIICDGQNSTATFVGGTNISLIAFPLNDTIRIDAAGGDGGESNTQSSPTHANSLVLAKTGVDLPIKGIACNGSITCLSNSTDITLSYTPSSSVLLLSGNETNVSSTVSNTDTVVRTYSLGANSYSSIIVESEVEVSFGILSTPQDILIKIKDGGSTKETFTTHSLAQIGESAISAKVSFTQTGASTITITQSGASADANTSVLIHSLRIYGVI